MGVPDMDGGSPAKKRLRLSLKSARQKHSNSPPTLSNTSNTNNSADQGSSKKSASEGTSSETILSSESNSTVTSTDTGSTMTSSCVTESTSESSQEDSRVPAVASLENFGNTCFMNSILQVLRYTPTFLDNLAILYHDIQLSERIKRKQKPVDNADTSPSFEEENSKLCWKVVKSLYKVYRDLTLLEEKYEEVASNDVMSMAVKPIKVLQAVRDLNPMFKGHLQHDAQEFMRCFLCYLQDAEKEVQKFYCEMPHRFSPKPMINPIMRNFLNTAKSKVDAKLNVKVELDKLPEVEMVKVNLFSDPEIVNGATVKSPSKVENTPRLADTAGVVENLPKIPLPISVSSIVAESQSSSSIDTCASEPKGNLVAPSRKARSSRSSGPAKRNQSHPYDSPKIRADRKAKKSKMTAEESETDAANTLAEAAEKSQPLISTVFAKTYAGKKRLGMSGAVLSKKKDVFDKINEPTGQGKDALNKKVDQSKSEGQLGLSAKLKPDTHCFGNSKTGHSQSDTCARAVEESYSQSFQDVFKMFAQVDDDDSDSSDSDTDIIREKKLARLKQDFPRRSPRKLSSCTIQSLCLSGSKNAASQKCSQSDSAINAVKSKLDFALPSRSKPSPTSCKSECKINSEPVHNVIKEESTAELASELNTVMNGIKTEGEPLEGISISPGGRPQTSAGNMSLWPMVKLEKCDYVFKNNSTSVSASYATQRMTPVKRSQRCPRAGNYLRERQTKAEQNSEALQKAIEEMFNSPVKSRSKFDLIERLFQGTMILRTRCLQCESSKERQEDFHDINIPVRLEKVDSDDEDEAGGGENPSSLLDLIEASTEVERLLEDNKYFCDECKCYVEAERSIHYDTMPDMLTLHLKRFSADIDNPGYVTKISDHVDIPLNLPCLRYKCPQTCLRPDHEYKLYGIVTHSGSSLVAGHYLSYVRALPNRPINQQRKPTNSTTGPKQVATEHGSEPANPNPFKTTSGKATRLKSGVQTKLPSRFDDSFMVETKVKAFEGAVNKPVKPNIQDTLVTCNRFEAEWFECDDETIRVFDQAEFEQLLSAEGSNTLLGTPYLLFYHKATLC